MCLTTVNGGTSTLAVRLSDFCRDMFRMSVKLETRLDTGDVIVIYSDELQSQIHLAAAIFMAQLLISDSVTCVPSLPKQRSTDQHNRATMKPG